MSSFSAPATFITSISFINHIRLTRYESDSPRTIEEWLLDFYCVILDIPPSPLPLSHSLLSLKYCDTVVEHCIGRAFQLEQRDMMEEIFAWISYPYTSALLKPRRMRSPLYILIGFEILLVILLYINRLKQ
jgi:hypothetical protein